MNLRRVSAVARNRSEDYFILNPQRAESPSLLLNLPGLQTCNLPWPFSCALISQPSPRNTRFLVSQKTYMQWALRRAFQSVLGALLS